MRCVCPHCHSHIEVKVRQKPRAIATQAEIERRFWSNVKRADSGCWEWTAALSKPPTLPYGRFKANGKDWDAHRASYTFVFGSIPQGLWVLHRCDNPRCVNPFHLYVGTPVQNRHDCITRGRWKKHRGKYKNGLGENHGLSKLTNESVKAIRARYQFGKYGTVRLARDYHVTKQSILAVVHRETWAHV